MITNPYRNVISLGPASVPFHWWDLDDDNVWADTGSGDDWSLTESSGMTTSVVLGPGGQLVPEFTSSNKLILNTAPWDGGLDDFSVACWARLENLNANAFAVMCQHKASGPPYNFQLTIDNRSTATNVDRYFKIWLYDGSSHINMDANIAASNISYNTWYHFGFTFLNSTKVGKIYIDGSEVASSTLSTLGQRFTSNTISMQIGGGNAIWDGQVAMTGIWDVELSADSMTSLYNGGAGLQYDGSIWS